MVTCLYILRVGYRLAYEFWNVELQPPQNHTDPQRPPSRSQAQPAWRLETFGTGTAVQRPVQETE